MSLEFGEPMPNRQGQHTRENTIEDLEIVHADKELNVSRPRNFSKLGGASYSKLIAPLPEDQHIAPTQDDYDINSNHHNGHLDKQSMSTDNNASPPTPLLNHSYHKYQTSNIIDNGYGTNGHNGYSNNHSKDISKSPKSHHHHELQRKIPSLLSIDNMNQSQLIFDWAPKATILSSIINLCNTIVGAAILALPYAAAEVGWLNAIILLAISATISQFTFQLQTSSGIIYNNSTQSLSSSYYNVSKVTIPKLAIISDIIIAINCLGAITSYLVIIGDNMPSVMIHLVGKDRINTNQSLLFLQERRFWISLYMVFLITPTAIPRKLDALKYSSALAIIFFGLITCTMAVYVFDDDINQCNTDDDDCGIIKFHNVDFNFFKAIPIYCFAFGSHPLGFALTNELLNSNFSRMNVVTTCSFTLTAMLYIIVSLLGYFTFGDNSNSNILTNYPHDDIVISICRIGLSIAVAFSYPVVLTPARHCISSVFFKRNASQINCLKFYVITIGSLFLTFAIAMIVDDLGIVMGFIGSSSSPVSILILPGLYYYLILRKTDEIAINIKSRCCAILNIYGSIVSVVLGIILIPVCLVILFM